MKLSKINTSLFPAVSQGRVDALSHKIIAEKLMKIRYVSMSPDYRFLLISFENNPELWVFDFISFSYLPVTFTGHKSSIRRAIVSPCCDFVFTGSWDGSIKKFNLQTGERIATFSSPEIGRCPSIFLTPDGKNLLSGSYDYDVDPAYDNQGRIWDLSNGNILSVLKKPTRNRHLGSEAIDIAADLNFIYMSDDTGKVYTYSFKGNLLQIFSDGGDFKIRRIYVSSNYIACACTDSKVRIFSKNGVLMSRIQLPNHNTECCDIKISPDETTVFAVDSQGSFFVFDFHSGQLLNSTLLHSSYIWNLSPFEASSFVCSGGDGRISFVSATGNLLGHFYVLKSREILITCPEFPNVFFYSSKPESHIKVLDSANQALTGVPREMYIAKLNQKALVKLALTQNTRFQNLISDRVSAQNRLNDLASYGGPLALPSN